MVEEQASTAPAPASGGGAPGGAEAAVNAVVGGGGDAAGLSQPAPAGQAAKADNPLLRHVDFYFNAAEVDLRVGAIIAARQKNVTIKGFRPGKVPLTKLRQIYGKDILLEVLQKEIVPKLEEHLKAQQERPVIEPYMQVEELVVNGSYKAHCHYEVMPAIALPPLSGLAIKKPMFTVDDKAVDEMIDILRRQCGAFVKTDAAADSDWHRLVVDYESRLCDSGAGAEGAAEGALAEGALIDKGENRVLMLSDKALGVRLHDALAGARAGDTRETEFTMAQDAPNKALRGRACKMTLQVKEVQVLQKAELDENLFSLYGDEAKTLEAFRAQVEEQLKSETEVRLRNFSRHRAMDLLLKNIPPFPLPQSMVASECQRLMHEAAAYLGHQPGQPLPDSAKHLTPHMFLPRAQRRVQLGVILTAWQRQEKWQPSEEEIETRLQEFAAGYENPQEVLAKLRSTPAEMEAARLALMEEHMTRWVYDNCSIEEEVLSTEAFIQDV